MSKFDDSQARCVSCGGTSVEPIGEFTHGRLLFRCGDCRHHFAIELDAGHEAIRGEIDSGELVCPEVGCKSDNVQPTRNEETAQHFLCRHCLRTFSVDIEDETADDLDGEDLDVEESGVEEAAVEGAVSALAETDPDADEMACIRRGGGRII